MSVGTDPETVPIPVPDRESRPADRTPRFGWPLRPTLAAAAAVALAVLLLDLLVAADAHTGIPEPIRVAVVLAGALLLPGAPIVAALRIPGRAVGAGLVIALSLAATILAAQFTIVPEWWHPLRTQAILAVSSLVLCVLLWRRHSPADVTSAAFDVRALVPSRARAVSLATLTAALALFVVAARSLDFTAAREFGIVTEIGAAYVAGLALVSVTIVVALSSRVVDRVVMTASVLVLVTFTTLLVSASSGETSVPTAFVHRGFISALVESGMLPPAIDARFSWAGFFSGSAHLVSAAGLPDAHAFMTYAPLFFNALMIFPLYAIALVITGRVRLAWLSVVLYQLFNWYQQDYFAPQAVALFFYSTIVATLLWQLRSAPLPSVGTGLKATILRSPRRTPGLVPGFGKGRTLAVGAVLLVIVFANTVTHQITPMLVVIALAVFSYFGATRYRTMWLAAGLVFAAWFSYGATDYWMGHLQSIFDEIGQIGNSVGRGVSDRITGDPTYQQMQYLRMGASGVFALVAFAGWLLSRGRRTWLVAGFVCAAPFSLVVLQSYGGEMIIRCFVLASPVLAPFAAIALAAAAHRVRRLAGSSSQRRRRSGPSRYARTAALSLALLAVAMLLTVNRGLNTAFEASTGEQVSVSDQFVAEVPPGSSIMSWSHAPHTVGVRRLLDPSPPRMFFIDSYPCLGNLTNCALDREPSYIYITAQGIGMLRYQYGQSEQGLTEHLDAITASGRYLPMYEGSTVLILRRFDSPSLRIEES
ncbi:hypothetical protein G4H71_04090 [Rhodococcus triatomae]|uniref:Uncharacterized protein n=1 Tax=Rhodococcus triatomae TaxID=300028 RepID=A0A1G7ZKY9_9NOCA|nr:hypothetical protein [Rhodococcus triatomae]QNG18012.1 hypothetical protein G4H72_03950 [Rhodococcus triatomae]QNG22319.1 hypothetical protein G4H71_04090 [Rhodococcus triatomae]SDH09348.1 hypothetical protein SAMN05444695_101144 [Rhodococcus triatomae]